MGWGLFYKNTHYIISQFFHLVYKEDKKSFVRLVFFIEKPPKRLLRG